MAALEWDKIGDRTYQTGVDRGVLYLPDVAVPWNGLTSVEERFTQERKTYYMDGVKYLESVVPGDYSAQLKAYTYPSEFEAVEGVRTRAHGLRIHDQKPLGFGLSYRTLIGDDVVGVDRGYIIHLLYNLTAISDNSVYTTRDTQGKPIEFSWTLSGTPGVLPRFRRTVHISFDSTNSDPHVLAYIESLIYGTANVDAVLPPLADLVSLFAFQEHLIIIDNGDGTWTASGNEDHITIPSSNRFQIATPDAAYLDANTYQIPTSGVGDF